MQKEVISFFENTFYLCISSHFLLSDLMEWTIKLLAYLCTEKYYMDFLNREIFSLLFLDWKSQNYNIIVLKLSQGSTFFYRIRIHFFLACLSAKCLTFPPEYLFVKPWTRLRSSSYQFSTDLTILQFLFSWQNDTSRCCNNLQIFCWKVQTFWDFTSIQC